MILNRFLMSSTKQKPNILVVKVFKETLRDFVLYCKQIFCRISRKGYVTVGSLYTQHESFLVHSSSLPQS